MPENAALNSFVQKQLPGFASFERSLVSAIMRVVCARVIADLEASVRARFGAIFTAFFLLLLLPLPEQLCSKLPSILLGRLSKI